MVDVSRNVVAVLLVLVIAVSALGTWALLDQDTVSAPGVVSQNAQVALTVERAPPAGVVQLEIQHNS